MELGHRHHQKSGSVSIRKAPHCDRQLVAHPVGFQAVDFFAWKIYASPITAMSIVDFFYLLPRPDFTYLLFWRFAAIFYP